MNRTLVEAARSMMFHAGMPKEFWAEAIHTATYVHNRSPTSSLKEVTPFERLFGRKPDVSNLRVFGCIAFKHIPDAKRSKLDKKSSKCVFVGHPEGTKGYKLYDLEKKSFVRSRSIIFQERRFHNFGLKENTEFYNEQKEKPESSVVGAIITPNERAEEVVNDDGDVEVDIPVLHHHPVGAIYEDNFMREVEILIHNEKEGLLKDSMMNCIIAPKISPQTLINQVTLMKHGPKRIVLNGRKLLNRNTNR